MRKKKKIKLKIKKKNFIIFLIIIFLIILSITKTTSFIVNKIKDNKRLVSAMKPLNKDTTNIEIDIESAEFALGLRDDRPKLHKFVENRKAN